jgi:hypothetical protein
VIQQRSIIDSDEPSHEPKWLRNQPGVVAHTVQTRRCGVDFHDLKITVIQVRTAASKPAFPLIDQYSALFGYVGNGARFTDCK